MIEVQGGNMKLDRRNVLRLGTGALATPFVAPPVKAQFSSDNSLSETNVPRVGILLASPPNVFAEPLRAFDQTLNRHGYIQNKTIRIVTRSAASDPKGLKTAANDLAALPASVILTAATTATQAAKEATNQIPIVFVLAGDPIATGFVKSLDQPGGNITGVTNSGPELSGLRLRALKEAVPSVSRVAVIGDSDQCSKRNPRRVSKRRPGN